MSRRLRKWRVRPTRDRWVVLIGREWRSRTLTKKSALRELVHYLALREPGDVMVRIHRQDGSLQETRIFPRDAIPKAWLQP